MKIEIWSDVVCPFCYIGKRRLEEALKRMNMEESVEIVWRSYLLMPDVLSEEGMKVNEYLAEHKGISMNQAVQMNERVSAMAAESGLDYHLEKARVVNSRKAHRFSHWCAMKGKQNEAEELLFKAYFTEGKNIAQSQTLKEIAEQVGLDFKEWQGLDEGAFSDAVEKDIQEAMQIGVRGVPFFVFDRKYAISGAQDVSVFEQTIQQVLAT